jgi:hypothetical protein
MVNSGKVTFNTEYWEAHENKDSGDFYYGQAGSVNNGV